MESPSAKTPLLQPSWLRVIVFVLLYLVVSLFAYKVLDSGIGVLNTFADNIAKLSGNPDREFNFILLGLLTSFLLSVLLVVLFTRLVDRRSVSSLGFEYRGYLPDGIVGFLLPLVIIGTVSLVLYFTKSLAWTDITFTSGDFLNGLFLMIVIAVGEEMVFRGYILNNLMQSLNRWLALAISAALFALMHSNNPGVNLMAMINLFAGGLLLGINYVFTRNLWFSILLHTGWNFLQGPVLGFPVSGVNLPGVLEHELKGDPVLTGGAFGLEASLLTGILLILSVLILFFVYRWRAEKDVRPSI
jgi:uncharacterized protein